jgi:NAD(P)H-nitrite reductase large subunit
LILCRCEEITEAEIAQAIAEGCDSVTWVKRKTRAGMGLCQGQTCGRLVARMIAQETGQDISQVLPDTHRPPVRPIPLDILEKGEK